MFSAAQLMINVVDDSVDVGRPNVTHFRTVTLDDGTKVYVSWHVVAMVISYQHCDQLRYFNFIMHMFWSLKSDVASNGVVIISAVHVNLLRILISTDISIF